MLTILFWILLALLILSVFAPASWGLSPRAPWLVVLVLIAILGYKSIPVAL